MIGLLPRIPLLIISVMVTGDCMWAGTFLEEVPLICSPDEAEGSEEVVLLCALDEVCDRHWSSELSMEKEVI